MRAGRASAWTLGDVDRVGTEDHRQPEDVVANEPEERQHTVDETVIVVACLAQMGDSEGICHRLEALLQSGTAAPGLLDEEVQQPVIALRPLLFELGERDLGLLLRGADQPERRCVGADGGVVEQALVDVADLLDAERAEAEWPPLAPARGRRPRASAGRRGCGGRRGSRRAG